jgi:hypothetical protein
MALLGRSIAGDFLQNAQLYNRECEKGEGNEFIGEQRSFVGVMYLYAVQADVIVVAPGFDQVNGYQHALRWRGAQCLVEGVLHPFQRCVELGALRVVDLAAKWDNLGVVDP